MPDVIERLGEMTATKRVRMFLDQAILKLESKIKASYEAKKIPADYSLGFINGLLYVQHQLNGGNGPPKFYNRETSIGTLPMPVALRTAEEMKQEFRTPQQRLHDATRGFLEDQIITQARGLSETLDKMSGEEEPSEKLTKEFSMGLAAIKRASNELEQHMGEDDASSGNEEAKAKQPIADEPSESLVP